MNAEEELERAINEEVRIQAYDSAWPLQFMTERDRLCSALPADLELVEHIGSTAVPGLAAKPVIDIMAGVTSLAAADALFGKLWELGYGAPVEFNASLTDYRWLMRQSGGRRVNHLHLVVPGSERWLRNLRFRDALRADRVLALRYERLKFELANRHHDDREAYTQAKVAFFEAVSGSHSLQA
jgi:GrpB-like predicted nucleotidyltransferase (UPF0157 family)